MIAVDLSSVEKICLAGQALFEEHVRECEPVNAEVLEPDWDGYKKLEDDGQLLIVGAWAGSHLVGYGVGFIYPSLHYKSQVVCTVDVLFVDQATRRQRAGLRMLNKLRDEARKRGAAKFNIHAKPHSKLESMLRLLNFQVEETMFSEDLSKWVQPAESSAEG